MARTRNILTATLVFNSLSALGGGLALVAGALPVPMYLLRNTPFDSFVIPGLFLAIVIGGSSAAAAVASCARMPRSLLVAGAAGVILIGWIAGETILIEGFSWLQGLYLLTGATVVALATHLAGGARSPHRLGRDATRT
ncbi:hypothetical protein [Pengzhenrongella sicca]|uniref:Uncharacterized protein n=1 Tax=Pengzhenrongella sicca TaxID=2819238 RepID=A0A8A4ZBW6_9MICO|nr:hypothetical protein [Pengzhenrongella sicca]QTE28086.1 hypothetical protein J4E96_11860 [Pengzhenrongella sicca]